MYYPWPLMSELSWLPCEGAHGYRVDLLGPHRQSSIETHIVTEPRLALSAVLQRERATRFRVAVTWDERSWKLHVPEAVILDRIPEPTTTVTWDPSGAPAYRLLVKDDTLGEIVVKQPVTLPPAPVSWHGLDPSHPHRVRVQEWRDSDWHDIQRYSPLLPPTELGAPPAEQQPPAQQQAPAEQQAPAQQAPSPEQPTDQGVQHWVAVRLSALPPGGQHGERRPQAWWESRLELLEAWTIPSIRAADGWVILADRSVPPELVRDLAARHAASGGCTYREELAGWQPIQAEHAGTVAVTHMTAGDCLHPSFDAHVRRRAAQFASGNAYAQLLSFPLMMRFDRERDDAIVERLAVAPVHTVMRRDGLAAVREELSAADRPFFDSGYASRTDASITALLRAWPGPNAASPLHGELITPTAGAEVQATFLAALSPAAVTP